MKVGYLSGSPRISTRPDADNVGPRAHIVGFLDGLRSDGHTVEPFVVGDLVGRRVSGTGSSRLTGGGRAKQLAVDVARLGLRPSMTRRAWRALPSGLDVVYERFALFQELGRPWKRAGIPWVVETNALLSEEARHERGALALQGIASRLERRTYQQADLVVAVSERLRDILSERAGVCPDKVLVVPNGVDVQRFAAPMTAAGAVGSGQLVVGFVGFVIERQGLADLIRAVAVLRRRGVQVCAVIVGDGPDRSALEQLAHREGIGDAVRFTGQQPWEQIPACMSEFSVGYSGQRGVGGMTMYHSPLKLYEYLASGRPVVASANPDAEAALTGPRAGWTYPPGDVDALVDVLGRVAALPAERLTEAGSRGREHVARHHTWSLRARQVVDALHDRGLVRS